MTITLSACAEKPSFELRWRVTDDSEQLQQAVDSLPLLSTAIDCSEHGLSKIRLETHRDDGTIADRREFACFPQEFESGDPVPGPALDPGTYTLHLSALRRGGDPWQCNPKAPVDGQDCDPLFHYDEATGDCDPCIGRALASIELSKDGELDIQEFAFLTPPQCNDGIDNDGDGRIDELDPACLRDPEANEADESGETLVVLRSLFLDNSAISCEAVEVDRIRIEFENESGSVESHRDLDCEAAIPAFSLALSPGTKQAYLTAGRSTGPCDCEQGQCVGQDGISCENGLCTAGAGDGLSGGEPCSSGDECASGVCKSEGELIPRTVRKGDFPSFFVDEQDGSYFQALASFASQDFLEPIIAPVNFSLNYSIYEDGPFRGCKAPNTGSKLEIDRIHLRILDEDGQPLSAEALSSFDFSPDTESDGWLSIPCPNYAPHTQELTWGSYTMEAKALSPEGELCFASAEALPLNPNGIDNAKVLPRVLDEDGAPAPSCRDCDSDDDCVNTFCVDGVCTYLDDIP